MCSEEFMKSVVESADRSFIVGFVDADDDIQLGTAGIDHSHVDACVGDDLQHSGSDTDVGRNTFADHSD